MESVTIVLLVLLGAVLYLIYRVDRLERTLTTRGSSRRQPRVGPDGRKIIPILKEDIEPGPFKVGTIRENERDHERHEEAPDSDEE